MFSRALANFRIPPVPHCIRPRGALLQHFPSCYCPRSSHPVRHGQPLHLGVFLRFGMCSFHLWNWNQCLEGWGSDGMFGVWANLSKPRSLKAGLNKSGLPLTDEDCKPQSLKILALASNHQMSLAGKVTSFHSCHFYCTCAPRFFPAGFLVLSRLSRRGMDSPHASGLL